MQIPDSALVIIPRAFHAFTLEKPALTADLLSRFAEDVLAGKWKGNAPYGSPPRTRAMRSSRFPRGHDHLRAIPAHGVVAMSTFLGPLDATGRVPPRQQTRVAAFLVSCPWRDGTAACDRPRLASQSRLANGIEFAALPRIRNRLTAAPGDLVGARSGTVVSGSIVGSGLAAQASRRVADRIAGVHRSTWQRSAMPCTPSYGLRLYCRSGPMLDPFALALRRIELESGRLMQAQIMLLKSADLLPLRHAVSTAIESRHEQVRKLWDDMLSSIGIERRKDR